MNFLELCQELISETPLAGGDPEQLETVLGQTGDLNDAVRWTRAAALEIENLWMTWKFHWFEHELIDGLADGEQEITLPSFAVRRWDRDSFYLDKFTGRPQKLHYEPWERFRQRASTVQTGRPTTFTVLPSGVLRVNTLADTDYLFTGEGWRRPVALAANADEPLIPEDFHRIIVARAKIFYADKNDAPEVLEGAQAEHLNLLDKLQSDQLDSFEFERADHQDIDLSMDVPGGGQLSVTR